MADSRNNPKNDLSPLFKKLTKLFSGPIVSYNQQYQRAFKRNQLDKFASKFNSLSGFDLKKTTYNPFDAMRTNLMANQNRGERYSDFDQMEFYPILASALDVYADEMTTHSELAPLLHINCHNEEIKEILKVFFHEIVNIDSNLFGWCRTMCKYGDFFLYLDVDDTVGIKSVIGLPPEEVERLEGEDETNPNYVQFQWNSGGMTFENWQLCHFRVLGNDKFAPYGTSVLDPARRIWRQLSMMEDAMMSYRIIRAPDRRVFKIDVSGIAPEDVEQFMQKTITQLKRHQVVDPDTGRVDLRYNPMSIEEDYYIPVRAGTQSDITNLQGQTNATAVEDINYLKENLYAAIKIPKSYLTRGEGGDAKTNLSQLDVRFARTILRLQRAVIAELEKMAMIHLYILGYRGEDILSFDLKLNNPSKIAQMQELEFWKNKFEVTTSAKSAGFSERWVSKNILAITEEEFIRNQYDKFYDKKMAAALEGEGAAVTPEAGASAGELGGALGGALGGEGGGAEELGGAGEAPPAGGAETPAGTPPAGEATPPAGAAAGAGGGGEEEPLLVSPAGRRGYNWEAIHSFDDASKVRTTTPASKGKLYQPVEFSKGYDQRSTSGPRTKNMVSAGGKIETSGRYLDPSMSDRRRTAKGIMSENISKESLYSLLEEKMNRINKEVEELDDKVNK
jgi:hypothetical protein